MSLKFSILLMLTLNINRVLSIVGGEDAEELKTVGYHIGIRLKTETDHVPGDFVCNGALIEPDLVLTAATCIHPKGGLVKEPSELVVTFGSLNFTVDVPEDQQRDVTEIVIHPDFNHYSNVGNVALLKLHAPVDGNIHPVPIINRQLKGNTRNCIVTGWGVQDPNEQGLSITLQRLNVTLYGVKSCEKVLGYTLDKNKMMCAGIKGKGPCAGDLGAPLVCPGHDKYYLVGIAITQNSCGETGNHTAFTNIFTLKRWINAAAHGNAKAEALHGSCATKTQISSMLGLFLIYYIFGIIQKPSVGYRLDPTGVY